jgi:putative N-acetylmannosamine-6-phosphate epimerase
MFGIRSAHTLENNFRSTRRIASVAQALIEGGEDGMRDGGVEGVRTTRSVRGDGDKVCDPHLAEKPRHM